MTDLRNPKVQKILHSKAFAHLATIGPAGEPQSSPMWFVWDGEYMKFTLTTQRQKYRNITRDRRVAISITDVDDPYSYAEFRGVVERIEDDCGLAFVNTAAERYGLPVCNSGDSRVVIFVKVHHVVGLHLQSPEGSKAEADGGETNDG